MSLPSRERGLKFLDEMKMTGGPLVAPLAGAWIEISWVVRLTLLPVRRSPRGSVD